MTQEFHLSVTPIGGDDYLVRTELVAPGVPIAEEQVTWPVEDWLAQANLLMNDPLQGLLRGDTLPSLPLPAGHTTGNSENLVRLGQQLYSALFQRTVRDSWTIAKGIAQHRREILRLRLGLKDSRLPRLPWEVLHAGDRPVATGTDVLFSRYHSSFAASTFQFDQILAIDPDQPLRILIVLSAPTDQDVLALKQEAQNLREELQRTGRTRLGQAAAIDLTILDQPDREELTQTLEHNHYHVFHYAGHSNLGAAGGNLYLVSRKTGLTEVLNGDDLAGLLVNNGIRMAVFNSCRGVYTPGLEEGKTGNLAEALVKRSIPAVLAMAERIPDAVALNLSRLFYRNLKQAYPIDLSLSRARQGLISSYGSNQLYWALPILYLHPQFDGCLRASGLAEADELAAIELQPELLAEPVAAGMRTGSNGRVLDANLSDYFPVDDATMGTGNGYAHFDPEDLEYEDPDHVLETTIADLVNQLSQTAVPEFVDAAPLYPGSEAGQSSVEADTTQSSSQFWSQDPLLEEVPASARPTQLEAPSAHPGADFYPELEQMLASAGKLTDVLANGFRAVQISPQAAEAHHALGWTLHQQGYLMEAIAAYNQSLRLNPQLADAHSHLGFAQMQQGAYERAQQSLQRAIELNPQLADAHRHLEILHGKLSRRTTAAPPTAASERDSTAISAGESAQSRGIATATPPPRAGIENPEPPRHLGLWAGVVTILIGGFLVGWLAYTQLKRPLPQGTASTDVTPESSQASPSALKTLAIEQLNQGDLNAAQASIEALLDQNALAETQQVLAMVPNSAADNPTIHFLRGRQAWQSYKAGDPNYKAADAWKSWERAAKQPSPQHQNALGFAYYEDNRAELANQAWKRTLELVGQQGGTTSSADWLTAQAGTALSLMKLAASRPTNKRSSLISNAILQRQQVLNRDATRFQPDALAQNWLWSEKAIQDWRSLLAYESPQAPEAPSPEIPSN